VLAAAEADHAADAPLGRRQAVTIVAGALVAGATGVDAVLRHVGVNRGARLVLAKDRLEQLDLLLLGRENEVWQLLEALEPRDDLEGVALRESRLEMPIS
jgi:hypothetical protein